MKNLIFGLVAVLFLSVSCDAQTKKGTKAMDVNVEEFSKLVEAGEGQLVDVRTPGEYGEGYIGKAKLINLSLIHI